MRLVQFTFLLVLLREGVAALSRGPLSVPEITVNADGSVLPQTVHVGNGELYLELCHTHLHFVSATATAAGGCVEDCDCQLEGKCKPCSRFELSRQVHECLRTGYRQWAYCSHDKTSKYIR